MPLDGGQARIGGRVVLVGGGFVDPKTGEGRVELLNGRVLRLTRRNVRSVRSRWLTTRVVARVGGRTVRLRLGLAYFLITGGTTTLTLDRETFPEGGAATFRITDGRLQAETLRGEIGHRGALDLGPVVLQDIGFRPRDGVTAQVGDLRALVAWANGGPGRPSGGELTIGPVLARLTRRAAHALNFYFQTDRYREDMPLGTLSVRARLRG